MIGLALADCVVLCEHGHRTELEAGKGIATCAGERTVIPEGSVLPLPGLHWLASLQGQYAN